MAMVSTYGDFLEQKKKNEQIRATAGKLGTTVTGNPSTPGNPATQAGGITGANGATGVNGASDPYPNLGQISYAEGLSKYYGIGNNGTGAQMSQPQSLGEALGGGNLVSAAKPVSGGTQGTSGTSGSTTRQNAMSSPVTYAEFGYGGGANAGLTPKEQYGISYAEGFDLMNRADLQKLPIGVSGPQASRVTIDGGSSGSSGGTGTGTGNGNGTGNTGDVTGDLNLKLINGKTVRVPADGTDNTVKPGEMPPGLVGKLPSNVIDQIGADKTEITPPAGGNASADEKKDNTASGTGTGDGEMTYGEYLDKYYGGDAAQKNYDNALTDAESDYARAKATYGQKAETLGRMGLTGSGYGDYLEGLAYSEMQGAKQNAALTRDERQAEQQRSYGEYLENKKNTLSQNYQNWLAASANKTYDLDTTKAMLEEQVKNGDLTQAQADAILGNYGKGSDAGSAEQRPAILSKLTEQIMNAGLTDEKKIRAAIAAYQGAYGVTLTEDEIAGIISNIQGITGKGNTGTGTDADGETPPSETVAAAYNALLSTDANGNLIYGNASDEYLKHLLINSGYEAADAEEAIRRFRKTVEETGKNAYESLMKSIGIGSGKLILGNVLEQIAQQYGLESDEYNTAKTTIHKQNKELLDQILSDGFNIRGMIAKNMMANLLGDDYSAWDSLSDQEKWAAIKNAVLNSDSSFNDGDTNEFLAKYNVKMAKDGIAALTGKEKSTENIMKILSTALIDCANDSGGLQSSACAAFKKNLLDNGIEFKVNEKVIHKEDGDGVIVYTMSVNVGDGKNYEVELAGRGLWGVDKNELDRRATSEKTSYEKYPIQVAALDGSVFIKISGRWSTLKIDNKVKLTDDQKTALLQMLATQIAAGK